MTIKNSSKPKYSASDPDPPPLLVKRIRKGSTILTTQVYYERSIYPVSTATLVISFLFSRKLPNFHGFKVATVEMI